MLNKKQRFSSRESFNLVKSTGLVWSGKYMLIRFLSTDVSGFHAAVVVSKKVTPQAVSRNTVRRRVYESIRIYLAQHSLQHPLHMIAFVNKKINSATFQEIADEIRSFLTSQQ